MPASDLPLSIGYWIVNHKATLKRWWAISLLLVMFLAGLWAITAITVFLAQEPRVTARMVSSADMLSSFAPSRIGSPAALKVSQPSIIVRSPERIDVAGAITNPNREWGATMVKYHFTVGSVSTSAAIVAVNPGQTRPVAALNVAAVAGNQPQLVIDSVGWTRGPGELSSQLFTVKDVTWAPSRVTIAGVTVETVTVAATMRNSSVYNYHHVDVPVIVRAAGVIVAIDELRLDEWPSQQEKKLTVSWPYRVSGVTAVEVLPTVDQYDRSNRF